MAYVICATWTTQHALSLAVRVPSPRERACHETIG